MHRACRTIASTLQASPTLIRIRPCGGITLAQVFLQSSNALVPSGVSGTHQKRPGQLILDATAQQKLVLGTQVDQPAAIAMPSPMPSPTTMLLNSYAAASSYPNGTASLLLTARHVAQHDESAERSSLVPWDDWEGGGRGLSIAKDLQTPSSVFGARSGAYEGGHSSLIIATELHGSVLVTVAKNGACLCPSVRPSVNIHPCVRA